ncbi:DNA/RNA non-specific endonuclease [Tahibacter caeni]|uniref:DNA/RNA non-specific endonuclease n=1 Tax=Tahibacter caeni TaxID=1453545 RepID=UPI0021474D06|nr:DNA/RNA non-specific endonuclease [Tahibacter caeni]
MYALLEQIAKAKQRQGATDLRRLADNARDKPPAELETRRHLDERREFLRESLGDTRESTLSFERIIAGNELQDVNYLARGERAARAVARVAIRAASGRLEGWGTGFLIAPGVLLTNNHVLPDARQAQRSEAHFGYELDVDGNPQSFETFALEPERLFRTSEQLDFTVVAVRAKAENGPSALSSYGCLPLVAALGKVSEGEWLTIVQHPRGERKQLCIRENQLIKRDTDVLWYSTDTLGGSSGSPVFNNDWFVVALHHSGVPEERDGRIQTISGRDFDPSRDKEEDIRWIANEGIRVSRIVDSLKSSDPAHPLLQPVFAATPGTARIEAPAGRVAQAVVDLPTERRNRASSFAGVTVMDASAAVPAAREVVVRLGIDTAGSARLLPMPAVGSVVRELVGEAARSSAQAVQTVDVPFNARYDDRRGYAEDFLAPGQEGLQVLLPELGPGLSGQAEPLLIADPFDPANQFVLKYHNFSVVMHAQRRFAIYSAANIDFGGRFDLSRPPDVWRTDPRIRQQAQVANFYYARNQFDRGHLTRREDLEFGATRRDALISAADTCHWSNCTPQHARFNQSKTLWQGIERYLLEESIQDRAFRAQVLTGPVLDDDDPVWERHGEIQYPVRFWKVVAALNDSGKLFATAYLLDQSEVVARYGVEAAGEQPFGAFKTFQVPVAEIERLTGLLFFGGGAASKTRLSEADPLAAVRPRRRARVGARWQEAEPAGQREGYYLLESLDAIVRD